MNRLLLTSLITAAFVAVAGPAVAANDGTSGSSSSGNSGSTSDSGNTGMGGNSSSTSAGTDTSASSDQDIYGAEVMTPAERAEFRAKMQSAKSSQERERLRVEHQAAMQSRAKQRGITLSDEPTDSQSPGSGAGNTP